MSICACQAHIKRWGRQIIDRAAPEAAIALRRLNSEADLRADLPKIRQPTLIIHCEGDKIMPVDQTRTLAKTLPNAELVILKDSGHIPTLTRPAEIAGQIERFLPRGAPAGAQVVISGNLAT